MRRLLSGHGVSKRPFFSACQAHRARITPTPRLSPWPTRNASPFTTTSSRSATPIEQHASTDLIRHAEPHSPAPPASAPGTRVYTRKENLEDARRVARQVLGIDELRPEQEKVILGVLEGKSALLKWPPRSGRSLCYVVPALVEAERSPTPGLTLVISPARLPINIRVRALQAKGIRAYAMDERLSRSEQERIIEHLQSGEAAIYFLRDQMFRERQGYLLPTFLLELPGGIRQLVIDEADHISRLSINFRPDYEIMQRHPTFGMLEPRSMLCQTHKATEDVAKDVCRAFGLPESNITELKRPLPANIYTHVVAVRTLHDKYQKILNALNAHHGRAVIFMTAQRAAYFARKLAEDDIDATTLTVTDFRVNDEQQSPQQERLLGEDELARRLARHRVFCASPSASRYLDGSNISYAVFQRLPRDIEDLVSGARLVGQNGQKGRCTVILCAEELRQKFNYTHAKVVSVMTIKKMIRTIFDGEQAVPPALWKRHLRSHTPGDSVHNHNGKFVGISLERLSARFQVKTDVIKKTMIFLQDLGYIQWGMTKSSIYLWQYKILRPLPSDTWVIHQSLQVNDQGNLNLHVEFPARPQEAYAQLKQLNRMGFIRLGASDYIDMVQILRDDPTPEVLDSLARELHARLVGTVAPADRELSLIKMLTAPCFNAALASYLGTRLPGGRKTCGHCSSCTRKQSAQIPEFEPAAVDPHLVQAIIRHFPLFANDPRALTRMATGTTPVRKPSLRGPHDPDLDEAFRRMDHWPFGCMAKCSWQDLIEAFAEACGVPRDEWKDC